MAIAGKAEIKTKLVTPPSVYEYHTGRKYDADLIAKHDIVLTCYSILNREQKGIQKKGSPVKIKSPLDEIEFYRVILDEAHAIKETTTTTSKMAMGLETARRWAVTGTVMQVSTLSAFATAAD